jgi:hypothetical protein
VIGLEWNGFQGLACVAAGDQKIAGNRHAVIEEWSQQRATEFLDGTPTKPSPAHDKPSTTSEFCSLNCTGAMISSRAPKFLDS